MISGSSCLTRLAGFVCLLLLAGCAARTPEVSYYSLSSMGPFEGSVHNMVKSDISLGIGPVTIPDYLKRAQIATRLGDNRFRFDEFHRWSGLFEENIVTVVGNNLGILLGTDKIASYPWLDYFTPDYRIIIQFQQFDGNLQGEAKLIARWAISDSTGQTMLASGRSEMSVPLAEATYLGLVEANSRLLADFSKELADEVKMLLASK